jgi:serine/threonine protein phosphatase PrpC
MWRLGITNEQSQQQTGPGQPTSPPASYRYFKTGEASVVGTKYGDLNQDFCVLKRISSGGRSDILMALVLDGHGMLGEVAASAAGEVISTRVEEQIIRTKKASIEDIGRRKMKEIIQDAFQKAHEYVLGLYNAAPPEYHFPCGPAGECTFTLEKLEESMIYKHPHAGNRLIEFGTTASLVIADKQRVVVAHVGDSDVVVGALESGFVVANEMTTRHCGSNIKEQFRIGELLGEDDALMECANLRDDGYLEVINLGGSNSSVALGMTRAVGHFHLENYGVISRPEIRFYDFEDEDICIILATDGVWDVMHPRDAVHFVCDSIISKGRSEKKTAMDLCETCVSMQLKASGGADNTTAIVISIPHCEADIETARLIDQDETNFSI